MASNSEAAADQGSLPLAEPPATIIGSTARFVRDGLMYDFLIDGLRADSYPE
jgi:hypothetical protein